MPADKLVALRVPRPVWLQLRDESARQNVPITELVRRWIEPHLAKLPNPVGHVQAGRRA